MLQGSRRNLKKRTVGVTVCYSHMSSFFDQIILPQKTIMIYGPSLCLCLIAASYFCFSFPCLYTQRQCHARDSIYMVPLVFSWGPPSLSSFV
jgi:hypothetical protein